MKLKSLLLGFFIGGAAAGISTLLSAPASGKNTRKQLQERSRSLQNQLVDLKDKFIDIKSTTITASKEGTKEIIAFSADVKQSISSWKKDILPHQQELQKELKEIENAIQELEKSLNVQKN
ncbi:gas vesicle protein [Cytobacillus eiseniae]|uniref:Gas vesicle protein n=1 Tax=Cytobacillus eiseniae TaxID=762947 RepID=A0ABS4RDV0_9BACI|nr:YtxH domain-containing protein [Cytobacillus eiseniae]MBP2241078.1 gas vesicle protein [Cytobacillus eiseniae]